jgi:pilus assembly protein CpaB
MNWKTWVPLVLAVALGLVAMKVARDVMSKNQPAGNGGGGSKMVVAKHDIAAGAELTPEDLEIAKVASEVNSAAVFTDLEALKGRVLSGSLIKGSPILEAMLAPNGKGSGLQALIPDGMRAITVEINEISGVAGNLVPGCRVDVLSTLNGDGGEMMSRTVVQNVKVQSMGAKRAPDDNAAPTRSVTLLASPKEAEAIELATSTGKPRLILRSGSDYDLPLSEGVHLSELRGGSIPGDPFNQQPPMPVQQVVRAGDVSPSSQPSGEIKPVSENPAPRPWRRTRQIKIIRAGVESEMIVEEMSSPMNGRWITNLGTDELPANEQ